MRKSDVLRCVLVVAYVFCGFTMASYVHQKYPNTCGTPAPLLAGVGWPIAFTWLYAAALGEWLADDGSS